MPVGHWYLMDTYMALLWRAAHLQLASINIDLLTEVASGDITFKVLLLVFLTPSGGTLHQP